MPQLYTKYDQLKREHAEEKKHYEDLKKRMEDERQELTRRRAQLAAAPAHHHTMTLGKSKKKWGSASTAATTTTAMRPASFGTARDEPYPATGADVQSGTTAMSTETTAIITRITTISTETGTTATTTTTSATTTVPITLAPAPSTLHQAHRSSPQHLTTISAAAATFDDVNLSRDFFNNWCSPCVRKNALNKLFIHIEPGHKDKKMLDSKDAYQDAASKEPLYLICGFFKYSFK